MLKQASKSFLFKMKNQHWYLNFHIFGYLSKLHLIKHFAKKDMETVWKFQWPTVVHHTMCQSLKCVIFGGWEHVLSYIRGSGCVCHTLMPFLVNPKVYIGSPIVAVICTCWKLSVCQNLQLCLSRKIQFSSFDTDIILF